MDAVKNSNPTSVIYGTVISESPLKIQVSPKLILTESQLVLTRNVTDFPVKVNIHPWGTYAEWVVMNRLRLNDKAVMIRQSGGQKYIVIDKAG